MTRASPKSNKPLTPFEAQQHAKCAVIINSIGKVAKKTAHGIAAVPPSTARRWRKDGPPKKRGRKPLDKKPRIRQLIKYARMTRTRAGRKIPVHPTAAAISRALKRENVDLSARQILRDLKSVDYVSRRRRKHPAVMSQVVRLKFAKKMQHLDPRTLLR